MSGDQPKSITEIMGLNHPPSHSQDIAKEEQFASLFIEQDVPSRAIYTNNFAHS